MTESGSVTPAVQAQYVHTNLIATDWRALARFYETVFGCVRVPPERDLAGPAMEAGTGLRGAHLRGIHLRLPGHGDAGPTLELFTYEHLEERPVTAVNRPGFGHLAFGVADVTAARAAVLSNGGRAVGEVVTVAVPGGGRVTWCYVTDPEDNVLELQAWEGRSNVAERHAVLALHIPAGRTSASPERGPSSPAGAACSCDVVVKSSSMAARINIL
jgi:predicted enzyme related to lactoylglutathione lyase